MGRAIFVVTCFLFCSLAFSTYAKDTTDYFVRQWSVKVTGTPNGDAVLVINLGREEGKLTGKIIMADGEVVSEIDRVEEKDSSITIYYNAQGYDIYFNLKKKDGNHIGGTLIDRFEVKGERVVEQDK